VCNWVIVHMCSWGEEGFLSCLHASTTHKKVPKKLSRYPLILPVGDVPAAIVMEHVHRRNKVRNTRLISKDYGTCVHN